MESKAVDFKTFEHAAWEQKAHRYQDTWGQLTAQPIETVLDIAQVKEGIKLFDDGCGPGHLCSAASRRGAYVVGGDASVAMIEIAQKNYPELEFVIQDAEALTLPLKSFDVVILNYLLLHVADQPKVLTEASKILKDNGCLVFTLWMPPAESPGLRLIFEAIKEYADTSVIPPAQDIFMFSNESYTKDFLLENGFTEIKASRFETYWDIPDKETFFSAVQAGTRMGGMIELQKESVKEKIKEKILGELDSFKEEGGYRVSTPSVIFSARKSG